MIDNVSCRFCLSQFASNRTIAAMAMILMNVFMIIEWLVSITNIRRSREQNKFICYAEARQYMWPGGANCAEAEGRANLFAMPRRDSICGPEGQIAQKPRAEQIYLFCRGATVYVARRGISLVQSKFNCAGRGMDMPDCKAGCQPAM